MTSSVQIFTEGSKNEKGVGAGIVIFESGHNTKSLKCWLKRRCTNNLPEQLAIFRAFKYTENIQTEDMTATIYTDNQITLDSLQNGNIHIRLIEEMRRKLTEMRKTNWKIKLRWVKAHVGIRRNELADTLAKHAATNKDITETYKKVPKRVALSELEGINIEKWQREWEQSTKGRTTKEYYVIRTRVVFWGVKMAGAYG